MANESSQAGSGGPNLQEAFQGARRKQRNFWILTVIWIVILCVAAYSFVRSDTRMRATERDIAELQDTTAKQVGTTAKLIADTSAELNELKKSIANFKEHARSALNTLTEESSAQGDRLYELDIKQIALIDSASEQVALLRELQEAQMIMSASLEVMGHLDKRHAE